MADFRQAMAGWLEADRAKKEEYQKILSGQAPQPRESGLEGLVGHLPQPAQQIVGMTGIPQTLAKTSDFLRSVEQGLFGDPRVTQAAMPSPRQAVARLVQAGLRVGSAPWKATARGQNIMLRGPAGQKVGLNLAEEGIADVTVVGGRGSYQAAQEAARNLGLNLRQAGTRVSESAQNAIQRAILKGEVVPTRSGIMSTDVLMRPASERGAAARKVPEIADALVEAWFSRIR